MPNANTFNIIPIRKFIQTYNFIGAESIDPFANKCRIAKITNDLDPEMGTTYCMDALDFITQLKDNSVDLVLFDPPYTQRQVSEHYKRLGKTVTMETTQSTFWSNLKNEISKKVKTGGVVLCFGYNSGGIGSSRGFKLNEILLVAHGGNHNDTICTAESKVENLFSKLEAHETHQV